MTFLHQAVAAFALSVIGASLAALGASFQLIVVSVASLYVFFLLWRSNQPVGRVIVGAGYLAFSACCLIWLPPDRCFAGQVFAVWLVRCLYYCTSPLQCLADLAMTLVAAGAAVWAFATGSMFLSVWSFFLVQGLFVWLPGARRNVTRADTICAFNEAKQAADSALQSLLSNHQSVSKE